MLPKAASAWVIVTVHFKVGGSGNQQITEHGYDMMHVHTLPAGSLCRLCLDQTGSVLIIAEFRRHKIDTAVRETYEVRVKHA